MADEGESESGSSAANAEVSGADLLGALQGITNVLQQALHAQQHPPPPATDQDRKSMVALREFKHQKPLVFKGDPDPVVAEQWLEDINKILNALNIRENTSKVTLAAYQFSGEATEWWKMILRTHSIEIMTWDQFSQIFFDKYFPEVMREAKADEFIKLEQGMMTVSEFDARFTKLSRYAPEIVSTEFKKARKFERGLRPNIRSRVSVLRLLTYAEVLERALIAEKDCEEFRKINEKKRAKSQRSDYPNKNQKTSSWSYRGFTAPQSRPPIPLVCFKCGKPGHFKKECPDWDGSQSVMGPQRTASSSQVRPYFQPQHSLGSKGSFRPAQQSSQASVGSHLQRNQYRGKGKGFRDIKLKEE